MSATLLDFSLQQVVAGMWPADSSDLKVLGAYSAKVSFGLLALNPLSGRMAPSFCLPLGTLGYFLSVRYLSHEGMRVVSYELHTLRANIIKPLRTCFLARHEVMSPHFVSPPP
jgi:hypothetical protein